MTTEEVRKQAVRLVHMVQGTMSLGGQGLDAEQLEKLMERAIALFSDDEIPCKDIRETPRAG